MPIKHINSSMRHVRNWPLYFCYPVLKRDFPSSHSKESTSNLAKGQYLVNAAIYIIVTYKMVQTIL